MSDYWFKIIILLFLISCSAFFSATETAFSSLNRIRLKMMADDGNRGAALAYSLTNDFDKMLSAVLIGNNIVNIVATSISTVLFIDLLRSDDAGSTVSSIFMTIIILIFGEVSPKSIAKESPEKVASFVAPLMKVIIFVLTPFVAFFVAWKKLLKLLFKLDNKDTITGDELINIVDEAESGGGIDEQKSDLIRSAISFSECPVGDILTPRVDVVAVDKDDSVESISAVFDESGFSRLPVYSENADNILGIIHIRDFNKYVITEGKPLNTIIKATVFVAKQMSISELLKLMQSKKCHIAVVVDEYGGTVGIATMEDILEELVGEIWDEYDEVIEEFTVLDDETVNVLGSTQLDKMFEYFDEINETKSESVTVGGWVQEQIGKIAEVGDGFVYNNLTVKVTKVEQLRVVEVNIQIQKSTEENEEE